MQAENGGALEAGDKGEWFMILVQDILNVLEELAPYALSEGWDNVGLLVGDGKAAVSKVLCALDVTEAVADEAVKIGANLIVAHHPVIFTTVNRITSDSVTGKILMKLIKSDISAICMHTNMDCAQGGVNDLLASALGLSDVVNMEAGENKSLGRVGNLPHEMSLNDFVLHVKSALCAGGVRYADGGKSVRRVAVGGGACGKMMDDAVNKGADTFVIGDCSYDIMMRAKAIGLNLIDAGHFPTENVIAEGFKTMIENKYPDLCVETSKTHQDCIAFA